ncbi:MAG TPA: hypothetical protein VLO11_03050 [Luteolibacter sp.]|nr:hypothetical protein [Luteolibacter sp.]
MNHDLTNIIAEGIAADSPCVAAGHAARTLAAVPPAPKVTPKRDDAADDDEKSDTLAAEIAREAEEAQAQADAESSGRRALYLKTYAAVATADPSMPPAKVRAEVERLLSYAEAADGRLPIPAGPKASKPTDGGRQIQGAIFNPIH